MKKFLAIICAVALVPAFAADKAPKNEKKAKAYTLDTCIVSDEKLGEMGDPHVFVHEGQEYKLCCKPCKKDFDKDPKKHAKKLEKKLKDNEKKK